MASNRLNTGTLYTDAASFADTNIATLPYPGLLGQFFEKDGKKYQLVQFKATSSAIAAGATCMWTDRDSFVVSCTVADSNRNQVAGVAVGTVTAGNYGYIQVRGNATITLTGAAAAGDTIVQSATNGQGVLVLAGTAPTHVALAVATAAGAGDLIVPLNGV